MRMIVMTAAAALSSIAGGSMAAVSDHTPANQPAAFLNVEDIQTPIFSSGGIEGAVNLSVMIQAQDEATINALRVKMPELRAALLSSTLEFSRLHASGFKPVNAETLDAQLSAAVKTVHAGADKILILKLSATPA